MGLIDRTITESEPLVSIIVPVFKVEKYLMKCVESLVNQTYENTEIILVDDGSPDRCGEMCDEFAEKYPNIKVIHQENAGQGTARNHGVKKAIGDYILFVDSDDYVYPDCIEYLMMLLKRYDADISVGNSYYLYEGCEPKDRADTDRDICLDKEEAVRRMNYCIGFGSTPWAKLIKKEYVVAHPFPEGQIYEDLAIMYRIFLSAERVAYGTRKIYCWLQREGSTMRMKFDERQMAAMDAVTEQAAFIRENYPDVLPSSKARYMCKIIELMAVALNSNQTHAVYKRLRKMMIYYPEVLRDSRVSKSQKLRLFAMRIGYLPTKITLIIHRELKKRRF